MHSARTTPPPVPAIIRLVKSKPYVWLRAETRLPKTRSASPNTAPRRHESARSAHMKRTVPATWVNNSADASQPAWRAVNPNCDCQAPTRTGNTAATRVAINPSAPAVRRTLDDGEFGPGSFAVGVKYAVTKLRVPGY